MNSPDLYIEAETTFVWEESNGSWLADRLMVILARVLKAKSFYTTYTTRERQNAASQAEPPSPRTCEAAQPNEKSGTRGEVA